MARRRSTAVGQVFGRLTVSREFGKAPNGTILWECICTCGRTKPIRGSDLNCGRTNSCGCLQAESWREARGGRSSLTHGMTGSPTYVVWHNLKSRCLNPKDASYPRYGGRGIKFDPRWAQFENFLADMGEKPDDLSLDRIDNNGHYCAANCQWTTQEAQSNNTSTSVRVQYQGLLYTIKELADLSGLPEGRLVQRLAKNWPVEDAVSLPQYSSPSRRLLSPAKVKLYSRNIR